MVSVRISHVGDALTGDRLIEPLRRAAPLLADTVADIPYTAFASISADPTDPAAAVERFGLLRELTEETVDAILGVAGPAADGSINIVDIRQLEELSAGHRHSPTQSEGATRPSHTSP